MGTFRKRAVTWCAEVCIKGTRTSATFTTKREAQPWAAQGETKLRENSAGKVPNRPFRNLLQCYIYEWGWLRLKSVSNVRRPPPTPARIRRPAAKETARLLHTLEYSRETPRKFASTCVGAAYLFAIETAMRAGEICSLEWQHVTERHLHLP